MQFPPMELKPLKPLRVAAQAPEAPEAPASTSATNRGFWCAAFVGLLVAVMSSVSLGLSIAAFARPSSHFEVVEFAMEQPNAPVPFDDYHGYATVNIHFIRPFQQNFTGQLVYDIDQYGTVNDQVRYMVRVLIQTQYGDLFCLGYKFSPTDDSIIAVEGVQKRIFTGGTRYFAGLTGTYTVEQMPNGGYRFGNVSAVRVVD